MKKSFVIVIALALTSVGALYSLPKVVVSDEKRAAQGGDVRKDASPQSTAAEPSQGHTAPAGPAEMHNEALPPEEQQRIEALRRKFEGATGTEKITLAGQLSDQLAKLNRFDSAAYYSDQIAQLQPTLEHWLQAGDRYYQAFTFAVDEAKGARLGEKTREYYQKALEQNPNLLTAKTNMAMTYMASSSPMQGIALLREVLEQEPDNESALFNLGLLSMRSNQYAKAVERFERILRNHPDNTRAQFYLGVSYAELGKKEEAKRWLLSVKKLEKDPTVQAGVEEYLKRLE